MFRSQLFSIFSFVILFLFFNGNLHAQYIIEQVSYSIPVSFELMPEEGEFEGSAEDAMYFFNIPLEKLKAAAINDEYEIMEEVSTFYLDGNNFAVESNSPEMGRTSAVSDYVNETFYYIIWDKKTVLEMKAGEMQAYQEQSEAMAESMMESLSPEMRAQLEAMEESEGASSQAKLKATGNSAKKQGFNCQEYFMQDGNAYTLIWATKEFGDLAGTMKEMSEKMSSLFPESEDDSPDEWELVQGMIPIEYKYVLLEPDSFTPDLEINLIQKISRKKPPADKFHVPGEKEGFTRSSMEDLMKSMMDAYQD